MSHYLKISGPLRCDTFQIVIPLYKCEIEQLQSVCSKKCVKDVYDFYSQIFKTAE